jgi:hypothetical protein
MVQLTPHDSAVLSRLVQFVQLPVQKRKEILSELESDEAKMVGEAVLDPQKYAESSELVRATVDRFREWSQANQRLGRLRTVRRRAARTRRTTSRDAGARLP